MVFLSIAESFKWQLDIFCQAAILSLNITKSSFPDGAAVAQLTVNQLVGGSNPSQGASFVL